MGHDHDFERQFEQVAQRRQRALLVPRRRPHPEFTVRRRQRVGEHQRALLGQPEWRLVAVAAVVERLQPPGKQGAGFDRLQLGFGDVVSPEQARPKGTGAVAGDEHVDVTDVIGLENDCDARRMGVQPIPDRRIGCRGDCVQHGHFAARLDAGRRDLRRPVDVGTPVGMLDLPHPQAARDVPRQAHRPTAPASASGSAPVPRIRVGSTRSATAAPQADDTAAVSHIAS